MSSEVCRRGTANKVMAGSDYYKMNRYHDIVCEAMIGLLWSAFEDFCQQNNEGATDVLNSNIAKLSNAFLVETSDDTQQLWHEVKDNLTALAPLWTGYLAQLGITSKYWLMYISMYQICKRYVAAERSGDWQQHLTEVQNMIPYIISAGHRNYAACLPLYLQDMKLMSEEHPEVYEQFMQGNFTIHRAAGSFNGVWTDLSLEQSYNRDGKTALLKGNTQNNDAREKYIKSVPFLTKVSQSVTSMANIGLHKSVHHGESKQQVSRDGILVDRARAVITNTMINPFTMSNTDDLINISTGEKSTSIEVLQARPNGLKAMYNAAESGSSNIEVKKVPNFVLQKQTKTSKEQKLTKLYHDEREVTRALCFIQGAGQEARQKAF